MSKFSDKYYDPNHPGWSPPVKRIAERKKIAAIVKMKPGKLPPPEYVRMHIGSQKRREGKIVAGEIYTIEAYEEELQEFGKSAEVISLEYARPTHQLVRVP